MENGLVTPTLIVLCGWPVSGKSTLAKRIAEFFGIRHIDIDDTIRTPILGKPAPNDGTSPEVNKHDIQEMSASYDILFATIDAFLKRGFSLVATATLSSKKWGQDRLWALCEQHQQAKARIIWCKPELTDEELAARMTERAKHYTGATSDPKRVRELQGRYEPIVIPHLELNTAPPNTVEESLAQALDYIFAEDPASESATS